MRNFLVLLFACACLSTAKSVPIHDQRRGKNLGDSEFAASIRMAEVMAHLNELQRIAIAANGTRASGTLGSNQTLDYLSNYLSANTNFKITRRFFLARDPTLASDPILLSSIDGLITNHTYSRSSATAEFSRVRYSTSTNFSSFVPLTVIPNSGCTESDWLFVNPPVTDRVILLKRGKCTFIEQALLATKFHVKALLLYNDGTSLMNVNLGQSNAIPALFLSFELGERLASAVRNSQNASIRIEIVVRDEKPFPVGNICADTPTGDPTQTIVVGSHSDSVRAGPGINDDGSGSAANLALAVTLARLFQTRTYMKYHYRLRFCWWGAEEIGILGSNYHVAHAQNATTRGERLTDYLAYLNFDMLGSPNFMFGIYDGRTANNETQLSTIGGSYKISELFRDWFIQHNLPWDFVSFGYGSDYAPFLIKGIAVGGLYSGSDDIKTQEERDRYDQFLGQGQGGIANADHDPCYHQACDSVQNINIFGYEKMIQAAASTLEKLARQSDLKSWLYSEEKTVAY